MPESANRHTLPPLSDEDVEVVDDNGAPLMIMPRGAVLRQRLRHKIVHVCLRDPEGKIFLYKRSAIPPDETRGGEVWAFAVQGRVLAGEARHAAALRRLEQEFAVTDVAVFQAARILTVKTPGLADLPLNAEITLFLTAKTSALPRIRELATPDGMFVDREEFRAIARDFPHMVSPYWNLALPYLF